ncbi:hypothetical protein J2801_002138 [Paraburkholderia phenoliruptrix]|uniref:hypothetical protein n=1 Tax=Paraburkholderia phenoliruptrix TaxID=252970 RepID=UPI0028594F8F|nr:hypothetical protein [Paraburkholderia phenoliruptrix]MDR6419887.1 hypothetical protein [Paraburkholderia phenoliruptrix]
MIDTSTFSKDMANGRLANLWAAGFLFTTGFLVRGALFVPVVHGARGAFDFDVIAFAAALRDAAHKPSVEAKHYGR